VQTLCTLGTLSAAVDSGRFALPGHTDAAPNLPAVLQTVRCLPAASSS
jgi:hypothetical protein